MSITSRTHRARQLRLVWAMVILVVVQGLVSNVLATWGPAHSHRQSSLPENAFSTGEFALWSHNERSAAGHQPHAHLALGHMHATEDGERHHHAASDASVAYHNPSDLGGAGTGDAQNESFPLSIGMVTSSVMACLLEATGERPAHRSWPCTHADPRRLERPPLPLKAS